MPMLNVLIADADLAPGWAVAHRLLDKGHRVIALLRDPVRAASSAEALARRGARVLAGGLGHPERLAREVPGVDALVASLVAGSPPGALRDPEQVTRAGYRAADAVMVLGARHLVLCSLAGANQRTDVALLDACQLVEQHVRSLRLLATILGLAPLLEDLLGPSARAALSRGVLELPWSPDRALPVLAAADVGAFAAHALERSERFLGSRVDLASDEVNASALLALLARVFRRGLVLVDGAPGGLEGIDPARAEYLRWLDEGGCDVDPLALGRRYPQVPWGTLEDWVEAQDWSALHSAAA